MAEKLKLAFQVNNFCNLNCTYCYQSNKGNKQLELNKAKFFIDKFFAKDEEYFKNYFIQSFEGVTLDFIGGECTLSMDIVEGITDYFYQKCIETGKLNWIIDSDIWLETNGTTYFEEKVFNYIKKHIQKLDLPITLDGGKVLHDSCRKYYDGRGSYEDIVKGIRHYMKEYGRIPNSKLTISPDNVKYLYEGILNFIDLGYPSVRCSCCLEDVWDEDSQNEYYFQLIRIFDYLIDNRVNFIFTPMRAYENKCMAASCGVYGGMICLDYEGNIYNCFRYSDVSIPNRESMKLGTVETGITNLDVLEKLRHRVENAFDEQCQKCGISSACEACPAFNYQHTGSLLKNLKTNCRVAHLEAKAFDYYLKKCTNIGYSSPATMHKNEWNDGLFEQNMLKNLKHDYKN